MLEVHVESMSKPAAGSAKWRNNAFERHTPSPSPTPMSYSNRPKSAVFNSPTGIADNAGHNRHQSFSPAGTSSAIPALFSRARSNSTRNSQHLSSTFEPSFIKSEELQRDGERVGRIEGENDFSGKRYVWLRDPQNAFVRGCILEELDGGNLLVQCDDGTVSHLRSNTR